MSATRIEQKDDGSLHLVTFDFKSQYSFEDFAEWITQELAVTPKIGAAGDQVVPFKFDWLSVTFTADWNDEDGCVIRGPASSLVELQRMQDRLSE